MKYLAVLILCLCFEPVQSQEVQHSEREFSSLLGLSTSYAPSSFKKWGTMRNTSLTFLKLQFVHSIADVAGADVHLSSELILTGWVHFPIDGLDGPRENRIGIGLTPFRMDIPIGKQPSYPFITSSAGLLFTDKPFPNDKGTRLNFLLDAGIGYAIQIKNNQYLQLGYKLHHLSNGNTGNLNPGVDSHMFFAKFLFGV